MKHSYHLLLTALLGLGIAESKAQTLGDFRSYQSGAWNADYTWEQWDGSAWITENTIVTPGTVTIGGDGFPVIVSTETSSKTTTGAAAHTINLPSGIEAGDMILIFFSEGNASGTNVTIAGYTELYATETFDRYFSAFWRIADGSEGATVNTNSFAGRSAHVSYRIAAGTFQGTPYFSGSDSGTDNSPNPPNLAPGLGVQPFLWLAAMHSDEVSSVTAPGGYGTMLHSTTSGSNENGADHAQMAVSQRFNSAASEDPGAYALGQNTTHSARTVGIQGIAAGAYPNPVVIAMGTGSESAADVSSHPISIPVGASGDLLVTVFSVDGNPTVSTSSSGWTLLGQASNGASVTGAIFWKLASGTTSAADALSVTTSNNQRSSHVTYRIRGATGISGASANNSSTNSNPPSHSASEAAYLWIATRSGDNTVVATAPPTGYVNMLTVPAGDGAGASTNAAYSVLGTAAATVDPGAFTSVTEQWVSWTLAILGPAPVITFEPIDYPTARSGDGYPSVAATAASTKTTTGSAAHVMALPAGIQAGDLLLVFFSESDDNGTDPAMPAGYTLMYSNEEGGDRWRGAWYRIADGSEGATVSTTNSFGGRSAHISYRIAAGSYQGVPAVSAVITGDLTTANPPNLVSGFGAVPTMWIAACHSEGTGTMTAPANYTANFFDDYTGSTGNAHARMGASHRFTTAASEDPLAYNLGGSNRQFAAVTIGIRGVARSFATVRNGHVVTVPGTDSVDDLEVENGGTLTITPGSLTINGTSIVANGTVNGLAGTLILGGTSGNAITVSGSTTFGVFNVTANTPGGVALGNNMNIRGTLQLNAGVFTASGLVRLVSNVNGTGRLGEVPAAASYVGNMTIERYRPAGLTNWMLMGSPITSQQVVHWQDDFITAGYPGSPYPNFDNPVGSNILWPSIRWYDETPLNANQDVGMQGVTSTMALAEGQGFAVWAGSGLVTTSAFTIDLGGAPPRIATSPIDLPMSYSNSGNPAADGWNLVSNPLPSPIDFEAISLGADVVQSAYFYNPANGNLAVYDRVNDVGSNGATNVIQSMQGFFLHATGSNVSGTQVTEANKVNGNGGGMFGMSPSVTPHIRLHLAGSGNPFNDEAVVTFGQGEPGLDAIDAVKFFLADPTAPRIGSMADDQVLSINAYGPFTEAFSIPVTVQAGLTGAYTITYTQFGDLPMSCIVLEDLITGVMTAMIDGATYSFTIDAAADPTEPRFLLHATAPALLYAEDVTCGGLTDGQASLVVQGGPSDVTWMNSDGETLLVQTGIEGGVALITGLDAGSYTVSMTTEQCGTLSREFAINAPFVLEAQADVFQATCADTEDGVIDLLVLGGTAPYGFLWSDPAASTSEDLLAGQGTYSVTITDANGCTWTSDALIIGHNGPVATITLAPSITLVNVPVQFEAADANGTFFWSFGDGGSSEEQNPIHTYALPGTYTVVLAVENGECTSVATWDIVVELSTGVPVTPAAAHNAWATPQGIVVEHAFGAKASVLLELLDATGRIAITRRAAADRLVIPTEGLAAGVWFVRLRHGEEQVTMRVPLIH